jgi:hypothetical protein
VRAMRPAFWFCFISHPLARRPSRAYYLCGDPYAPCHTTLTPPKTLRLTGEVWREGRMYTAYCRELDIASCGRTVEEAWRNLHEAFEIFLEETAKKGTLHTLLEEAGLVAQGETLERPEYFIGRIELPLPASR